jgi:hypothetical protein
MENIMKRPVFISPLHGITKPVFLGYLNFKFCNRYILLSYNKCSVFNFAVFCYFRIGKVYQILYRMCCYQILLFAHLVIVVCVELY